MSTARSTSSQRENENTIEQRATPLELFFDLVFVFAITQVTGLLSDDLTWVGVAHGMAVLAALWWAWVGYSWLTNAVPAEEAIPARLVILSAMAAMLIASLAVPGAFGEDGVLFGLSYFAVRLLHVALYALATRNEPEMSRAVLRLAPGFLGGPALLIVAGFTDDPVQGVLWVLALMIDYGAPLARGVLGFRVHAGHFVERHGLIVIIALGESIVAIGVGAAGLELGAGVVLAAILGMVVAAGLWWTYFDFVALAAERRLARAQGTQRAVLARDSYSYLHLPMVAGIVLVALGVKKVLADFGDPLGTVPATALCGGVALYLLGHNAFRLRDVGSVSVERLVAAAASLALVPLALQAPALVALILIAVLLATLVTFEAARYRELRRKLRSSAR
jgi:low temperature requirement protein LtrA